MENTESMEPIAKTRQFYTSCLQFEANETGGIDHIQSLLATIFQQNETISKELKIPTLMGKLRRDFLGKYIIALNVVPESGLESNTKYSLVVSVR